jgi:phage terminase large subunit-like protein
MMAANRVGKTEGCGGYELSLHLTGRYPDWWDGRRFEHPIKSWAAGTTGQTTRDILQAKLLGPISDMGTGLIPFKYIASHKAKRGVPDAIETVNVRHISGGMSTILFKSFDQGRKAFEGVEQDCILLDEEPPLEVYSECLIRTMTTNGMIMVTFTPLEGLSETVMQFMPGGQIEVDPNGTRFIIQATWDDVPHLDEQAKADLLASIPPYQRRARSMGIPQLGSGAIYPIDEDDVLVKPFPIPDHWPKSYGMDVGWSATAAIWSATDPDTGVAYFYHEYKRGMAEPASHTAAIKAPGDWIPGAIDPASRGRQQGDGKRLIVEYSDLGLSLFPAENAVEAGIFEVYTRLTTGRAKIFNSLVKTIEEFRIYRRDKNGKIVKSNDHLMDCMRYNLMTGVNIAKTKPVVDYERKKRYSGQPQSGHSWMGN